MFKYSFMQISVSYCPIAASVSTFLAGSLPHFVQSRHICFPLVLLGKLCPQRSSQDTFGVVMLLFFVMLLVTFLCLFLSFFQNLVLSGTSLYFIEGKLRVTPGTPKVRTSQARLHFLRAKTHMFLHCNLYVKLSLGPSGWVHVYASLCVLFSLSTLTRLTLGCSDSWASLELGSAFWPHHRLLGALSAFAPSWRVASLL